MSKSANSLFKVGEVVIGQGFTISPEYNGMECTILEHLRYYDKVPRRTRPNVYLSGWMHHVHWANGEHGREYPWNLRKRKQPDDNVDCDVEDTLEVE